MGKENKELDRNLRLMVKTSLIVFVGLILSKIFMYLYRIIIARHFGPEVYGLFSLAIMVTGWIIAFSILGLTEGILRFTSFYRGKKQINKIRYIFRISIITLFFSTTISTIFLFLSSDFIAINIFHNPNLTIFLKAFSILVPISIFSTVFLAVIRAFEKISWYSFITNILENAVKVAAILLLIFLGWKSNAVILSYILAFLSILIASYLVCKYKISEIFGKPKLRRKSKRKIMGNLFSYSWPLMLLGILSHIFHWIDSFAIGYFGMEKGAINVGFYNVAVPIAMLILFVPDIFTQLFLPLITKEFSRKNLIVIKELSKQIGKWIFLLNLPLFLLFILFPGAIINLLFGQEYLIAQNALRILSIGLFFLALFRPSLHLIQMMGKSRLLLINMVFTSIVNLILNMILVPRYGINGAAFSTMLSYIILSLIFLTETKYYLSLIPLRKKIFRILLISILPILSLIYIKQFIPINTFTLILQVLFFILFYFILVLTTGCLDKNDLMILRTIKKKIMP